MDMVTLAMAKAYSDSKGGYIESGKTLWTGKLIAAGDNPFTVANFEEPIGLEVGKHYTIALDSGTYTAVCKQASNETGTVYVGNASFFGLDDTKESFLVIEGIDGFDDSGNPIYARAIIDFNSGTSAIISTAETIHPIDKKYLPGVCLPVIELSEETKANLVANIGTDQPVTEDEKAFFLAAKEALTPCIVTANLSAYGMVFSAVLNLGGTYDENTFVPTFSGNAGAFILAVYVKADDVQITLLRG